MSLRASCCEPNIRFAQRTRLSSDQPTLLKSISARECCAQCEREQTEKKEASSILTDSRQRRQTTWDSMSANMGDFIMHPGGPAASWASIEPRVLIAPVPTTMIVIPKTILSVYRQLEVDPPSMQAMRARGFNGYGDLKLISLPKPEVSNGEVVLPRQNHWRSGNSLAASLIGMSSSRKRELGKYRLRTRITTTGADVWPGSQDEKY